MATRAGELSCSSCKKSRSDVSQPLKRCAKCQKAQYCSQQCQRTDWPSHRRFCISRAEEEASRAENYELKVQLGPGDIDNPAIWRTLSCPAVATFEELHWALQIAFGWATTHSYDFKVKDPDYKPEEHEEDKDAMIQRLIATLHRGQQAHNAPRENLLRIMARPQVGFGAVDDMYSGMQSHPQTPEKRSDKLKLYEILEDARYRGSGLEYEYDFGDGWTHAITVIGRTNHSTTFSCIAGEGHPCAEDAGGFVGWKKLVEAYRAARPDKEQREKKEWFETQCSNQDRQGLAGERIKQWDRGLVNRMLAEL